MHDEMVRTNYRVPEVFWNALERIQMLLNFTTYSFELVSRMALFAHKTHTSTTPQVNYFDHIHKP